MKSLPLLVSSAALLLASCNDSKLNVEEAPGTGSYPLTSANAEATAAAAFTTAMNSVGLADVGGVIGVSATAPGTNNKASANRQYSGFLLNVLQKIPFGPDVYPCNSSGTITISGDVADPFTLTAGDVFNIDANACDDGLGEVLDGLLSMTITEFSGDLFQQMYLLAMNASLTALQVTTATDVISNSGDTAVRLDTTAAPFISASVSGISMTTSSMSSSETLRNYETVQTVDAGAQSYPYTLTSSGVLDSTLLSNTVVFSTPVPFAGFDIDYPNSGEMLLQAGSSTARLVALNNIDVRIDIDSDGNGSVDESILTTWAALLN